MAATYAPSITITRRNMGDTFALTRYVILTLTRTSNIECPSELAWKFKNLVAKVRNDKKLLLAGSCHQVSLNTDNAQATFFAIGDELFEDSINWGRIVTFYAFAVEVAEFFIQKGQNSMVNNVVSWTALFVDQKLAAWIKQEGGWGRLEHLEFNMSSSPTHKLLWKGLLVTATTLGLGAFAAIVYTK